ncbi:nucleoside hydrolase [Oscillospiraceae bacterium PP1C4]
MRNILIDCDPGHDDAIAILLVLAHPEQFNLLGITTVGGNQTLEKVSENALKVLMVAGKQVPVAKGADSPLICPLRVAADAHGESGMDGPIFDRIPPNYESRHAVEFLKDKIMASEQAVTLIALGPLTNIALLIKTFPMVKEKIEAIALMGGSYTSGNATATAEFNFYIDPHAAYMVFHSGIPIIQAGTEVSQAASILHSEIAGFQNKGRVSTFVYELLQFYSKFSKGLNLESSPIFDACPVMYLIHPEIFTHQDYYVDIELQGQLTAGMSVTDKRVWYHMPKPNTKVLLSVDRKRFVGYLTEAIDRLDRERTEE